MDASPVRRNAPPASRRENLLFLSSRRGDFAARPIFFLHRSEPLTLVVLVEKEKAVVEPVAVAAPMLLVVQREAVDAFNEWSVRYLAMPEEERGKILDEGITLASARRTVMRGLIERDPRAALAKAVPPAVRQELPRAVVDRIEERVNERAFFGVLGVLAADGPAYRREVRTEDGGRYRAFVYGAKLAQQTTEHASIVGIAVDDVIAVDQRPLRVVAPGEIPNHPNNLTCRRNVIARGPDGYVSDPVLREGVGAAREVVEVCPVSGLATDAPRNAEGGFNAVVPG